jgi:hypothetical protein
MANHFWIVYEQVLVREKDGRILFIICRQLPVKETVMKKKKMKIF